MQIVYKPIAKLIDAEYNPRELSPEAYENIKSSLQRFGFAIPALINIHPDRENIIIGGHQRKNIVKAEYEKHGTKFDRVKYEEGQILIPCVERALVADAERELNIRLNKNSAEWSEVLLQDGFTKQELESYGFEESELDFLNEDADDDKFSKPEVEFTDQMFLDHNYVVLSFDNTMDWEVAKEKLGLKKVKELIDVKDPTKGLGRVIEGSKILDRIHD